MISGFSFWTHTPKGGNSEIMETLQKLKMQHHMTLNEKWFRHIANYVAGMCLLRASDSSRFIKLSQFLFMSVLKNQKVKIVVKKQTRMHLSVINLNIKIIRYFQVFVLGLTPKNENLEITETLQKRHNTEIWQCSFKYKLKMFHWYCSNWFLPTCLGRIKMFLFSIFYHYR